ncbi:hypothetical protein [Nocardioides insulae]|uniref:hypothetical protein n=1 Tax=Nocardioides insulae TaxID=394734 RepID=UPI00040302AD|nr:hypothetical protein [Nocardioides insulae]
MTKRVLLHVGTPKTGTSYLQDVLFRNRQRLADQGVHYPTERFDGHFLAALDLMRMPWGGLEAQAIGEWDRLAGQVRDLFAIYEQPTVIISHEILATASRSQAGRALESLGLGDPDVEIHLMLSVRDLVRQVPAEWQENVKHRSTLSYARFLGQIRDPERDSRIGSWFWGVQEIPDILHRWGADLPPEHIHLITVPAHGSAKDELWHRFERAFGLRDLDLELGAERSNPSMGVPETALVRRINKAANKQVEPRFYRPLVRELLAHQTLSQRSGSPRLALPPDLHDWVQELSRSWVDEIKVRGYDVIGDVDDLIGAAPVSYADPDHPRERQVAGAAVESIRALLLENARLIEEQERLTGQLHETQDALHRAYLRPTYRLREKIVRRLETSTTGRQAMKAYRRVRGRPEPPHLP